MVAARILRAAETMREPVVATDGDGTLWRGDIGDDLFFALCDEDAIAPPMHERLVREARAHGIAHEGPPGVLGRRLFDAHAGGSFPELLMFELMACAFAGGGAPTSTCSHAMRSRARALRSACIPRWKRCSAPSPRAASISSS